MAILANIMWRSFTGSQAHLAAGTDRIRRYARGYSPLIAFADPARPDWGSIAPHCEPGERFYCAEWRGPVPAGWALELDSSMVAMIWKGSTPAADDSLGAVRLDARHVERMTALTSVTRPGPFGSRTVELGEWYGVFDGERLMAMAGERLLDGRLHEISGVCTDPDYRGRGLAKRLTALVVRRQVARGETPFLHVASSNTVARDLYRRMGFVDDQEVAMRIVSLKA